MKILSALLVAVFCLKFEEAKASSYAQRNRLVQLGANLNNAIGGV